MAGGEVVLFAAQNIRRVSEGASEARGALALVLSLAQEYQKDITPEQATEILRLCMEEIDEQRDRAIRKQVSDRDIAAQEARAKAGIRILERIARQPVRHIQEEEDGRLSSAHYNGA